MAEKRSGQTNLDDQSDAEGGKDDVTGGILSPKRHHQPTFGQREDYDVLDKHKRAKGWELDATDVDDDIHATIATFFSFLGAPIIVVVVAAAVVVFVVDAIFYAGVVNAVKLQVAVVAVSVAAAVVNSASTFHGYWEAAAAMYCFTWIFRLTIMGFTKIDQTAMATKAPLHCPTGHRPFIPTESESECSARPGSPYSREEWRDPSTLTEIGKTTSTDSETRKVFWQIEIDVVQAKYTVFC